MANYSAFHKEVLLINKCVGFVSGAKNRCVQGIGNQAHISKGLDTSGIT